MIEKTQFGTMTIDGHTYTSDLLIFPDGRIVDQWWRAAGHRLGLTDIADLVDHHPAVIVAGMGVYGRMKAEKGLPAALSKRGITLISAWTKAAADRYNTLVQEKDYVAACFHLTC